ncbi:MAG: DHHA1 domain-containing protein, partial [Myxococcales bacterium]
DLADLVATAQTPLLQSLQQVDPNLMDLGRLIERTLLPSPPPLLTEGGLIQAGVDPELDRLMDVLPTIALSSSGRVASLVVTEAMLKRAGADADAAEGFIAYPRSIAGVEVALVLREEQGQSRVSLRSRGKVDVGAIATRLGGGGHRNASGCTLNLPVEAARERVLAELELELARLSAGGLSV